MGELEKESEDTVITPDLDLVLELALEGSSNTLNQNQFTGADMTNSLGDGVPGYETSSETHPIDQVENVIEAAEYQPKK
jgi:hypothetical protein